VQRFNQNTRQQCMKHPIFYLLIIAALFLSGACKKDPAEVSTDIQLRVLNATPATIYDCIVNPGSLSGSYNFGQIDVGAVSNYQTFDRAYSYGYVRLILNGNSYGLQPYDYVGETPLANGKYTYKITFSATNGISITLIKDWWYETTNLRKR